MCLVSGVPSVLTSLLFLFLFYLLLLPPPSLRKYSPRGISKSDQGCEGRRMKGGLGRDRGAMGWRSREWCGVGREDRRINRSSKTGKQPIQEEYGLVEMLQRERAQQHVN